MEKFQVRQWTINIEDDSWTAKNLDENGRERFFSIESGKYGEPLIKKEPELAQEVGKSIQLVSQKIGRTLSEQILEPESPDVRPSIAGIYLKLPIYQNGEMVDDITIFRTSLSNPLLNYGQLQNDNCKFTVSLSGVQKYLSRNFEHREIQLINRELDRFTHGSDYTPPSAEVLSTITTQDPKVSGLLTSLGEYDIHRHVPGFGTSAVYYLGTPKNILNAASLIQNGLLPVIHNEFSTARPLNSNHWIHNYSRP